jgi:hypothetical protein
MLMAKRTMLLAPLPSFRFSSYLPILRLRWVDPQTGNGAGHRRARECEAPCGTASRGGWWWYRAGVALLVMAHDEVGEDHELLAREGPRFVGGVLLQQALPHLGRVDALRVGLGSVSGRAGGGKRRAGTFS